MFLLGRVGLSPYFPFNDQTVQYFHDARTAIYQWARRWNSDDWEILFPSYFEGVELDALLAAKGAAAVLSGSPSYESRTGRGSASALSPKTKAIYLIHYIGFPGPVSGAIRCVPRKGIITDRKIVRRRLLSKFGESPLGSFGDVAIFSIRKTLPVPDGGALVAGTNKAYHFPRMRASPLAPAVACTSCIF